MVQAQSRRTFLATSVSGICRCVAEVRSPRSRWPANWRFGWTGCGARGRHSEDQHKGQRRDRSSSTFGVSRSCISSKSYRRRPAQGASASNSNCARHGVLHNPFLRRTPSFKARAWSWFLTRVVLLHQPQQMFCVLTIVLLLPYSPGSNLCRVADPQLLLQLRQQALEPTRVPGRLHPYPYTASLQASIETLCFLLVGEPPVSVSINAICCILG
jgi:hypothetical protein